MRGLKLLLVSLTMLFVFCAPTFAQSVPAASQYDPGSCVPEAGVACAQSIEDGVRDIAGNTEQGTDAVNDAMNDAAEASASPEAVPPAETDGSPDSASSSGTTGGDAAGDGDLASIAELPETGGVSPTLAGPGLLLVAGGLLVLGVRRR
ncbi:hypothetical protein GBA63_16670 [Rubrobacter tropicus]|uniref:Gram-positive cocci surface proteins LPxTG domain-containing protein n=1 Tax=Rubrobacter tropicus TaxID=2653851 RepID=A0A6G8QC71_9ACTN|nr:hypothetical protein [Rubrobacter tropicus]QIN84095.1 hypothetical protein GBA63_16670 [Rubrobacter tropicus]